MTVVMNSIFVHRLRSRPLALLALASLWIGMPGAEIRAESLNVDVGLTNGVPSNTFGGAASQSGPWNSLGLSGIATAIDAAGGVTDVSIAVSAGTNEGTVGLSPTNDIELLLFDNIFSSGGTNDWSILLQNVDPGVYEVFVYEAANTIVDSGQITVNGVSAGLLEGQPDFPANPITLTRGETFTSVFTTVEPAGTLEISGLGGSQTAGIAGFQVVFVPEPSSTLASALAIGAVMAITRIRSRRAILPIDEPSKNDRVQSRCRRPRPHDAFASSSPCFASNSKPAYPLLSTSARRW